MSKRRVLLVGAGAQAKYACEIIRVREAGDCVTVLGTDGSPDFDWPLAYGAEYLKGLHHIETIGRSHANVAALICIADPREKAALWARVEAAGLCLTSVVHPRACVASTASIGDGAIVNPLATVQPFARVGRGAMIHAGAVVEHDCVLDDFVNLAPGARLAGWVCVGEGATIYTGASVLPRIKVGARVVVGAGAVVTKDVPPDSTVMGAPARLKMSRTNGDPSRSDVGGLL